MTYEIRGVRVEKYALFSQQTSPKRWFGNMDMTSNCDVTNSADQIQMTTIWPWTKTSPMKIFCVRHCRGKSRREAATACASLPGWLSHWAVCHKLWWWPLAVQLSLCQLCNFHVSYSVMFVHTFHHVLLLYALVFHSLALTSRWV